MIKIILIKVLEPNAANGFCFHSMASGIELNLAKVISVVGFVAKNRAFIHCIDGVDYILLCEVWDNISIILPDLKKWKFSTFVLQSFNNVLKNIFKLSL